MQRYLGLCAVIRDEPYLDEWLAYHVHLGVDRFYLYDNESAVPLAETLAKWMRFLGPERLIIHDAPGKSIQLTVYNRCLADHGNRCKWIAFVDADEFIVPNLHPDLPSMLEPFELASGLALCWKVLGTNGHVTPPQGLQIENYTKAMPDDYDRNKVVKVILQPEYIEGFEFNPHIATVKEGDDVMPVVSENAKPVVIWYIDPPSWRIGQINHYYFRSRHEFYKKLRAPRADTHELRDQPPDMVIPEGDVPETSILRFVPGVKAIMKKVEQS
ncbi:MAG: hypothetical protein DELT_01204 [Desulfovibrio sp.]